MNDLDRRSFLATTAAGALAAAHPALAQPAESARLRVQLDAMFEALVDDSPRMATSLGLDKGKRAALKSRLDDNSFAAKDRRIARSKRWIADLKAIDRAKLTTSAKVDYDVVLYQQEQAVDAAAKWKFGDTGGNFRPYVLSQQSGAYQSVPDFLDSQHKVADAADAEAYLSRLHDFVRAMDEDLTRQKHDVALGAIPPRFICDLAIGQMKALRDQPAERTVMVTSLVKKAQGANVPGDWGPRATRIVSGEIFPALDRQIAAMQALKAKAKPNAAAWSLPDGEAYYADCVKASTTTNYSPAEVHKLGLDQVADLSSRLDLILKKQGLTQGSVSARLMALNNRPDQVFPNTDAGREEILRLLNGHIGEVYKLLPKAFATLPKAKVEVRRVPVFIQDGAANGYYNSAAPRRLAAGGLLHQPQGDLGLAALQSLDARPPRDDPRPPPADRARPGIHRDPDPAAHRLRLLGLRRGLGALRRTAGPGDGRQRLRPVGRGRLPAVPAVPRRAPGHRHRHPLETLGPRAGDPVHGRHDRQHENPRPARGGALLRRPRPGQQLQGRPHGLGEGPRRGQGEARRQVRPQDLPRRRPALRRHAADRAGTPRRRVGGDASLVRPPTLVHGLATRYRWARQEGESQS